MEIIIPLVLFVIGLAILIKGADFLVSGASSAAAKFKISPIVIGLTVVAFGTSAPELTVSTISAISGNTDIALGNIIGSNIANILLILGASAIVCTLTVHKNTVWKEIPMSFLGAVLMLILALQEIFDHYRIFNIPIAGNEVIGEITASNGVVLLSFFVIFLYYTFGIAKVNADVAENYEGKKLHVSIALIITGCVGLIIGSKFMVDGGATLARTIGVSDALVGLTLVALGTSLPELVTSIVAAYKREVDIAVGNVIGSNIFNIFFVLGITALIRPIPLKADMVFDIFVLFVATIFLFISLFTWRRHTITKIEGSLMLIAYVAYLGFTLLRG